MVQRPPKCCFCITELITRPHKHPQTYDDDEYLSSPHKHPQNYDDEETIILINILQVMMMRNTHHHKHPQNYVDDEYPSS